MKEESKVEEEFDAIKIQVDSLKEEEWEMGIDKAGRGPVFGPMGYEPTPWPLRYKEEIIKRGFRESKNSLKIKGKIYIVLYKSWWKIIIEIFYTNIGFIKSIILVVVFNLNQIEYYISQFCSRSHKLGF